MITKQDLENHREMSIQECFAVLKSRPNILMSWGSRSFTNVYNKGLMFRVSGFKHKGRVLVLLNGSDLYDVWILNMRDRVLRKIEGIFVENLVETIDRAVETDNDKSEDYHKKCGAAVYSL